MEEREKNENRIGVFGKGKGTKGTKGLTKEEGGRGKGEKKFVILSFCHRHCI